MGNRQKVLLAVVLFFTIALGISLRLSQGQGQSQEKVTRLNIFGGERNSRTGAGGARTISAARAT